MYYNVILRRVRLKIVADKSSKYYVFWVCDCSLNYPASKSSCTVLYRSSKKMDGIWNRYNLKSTGRIYTFGVLKCSEKFKVLDLL